MRSVAIKVYKFAELSDEAKNTAIEAHRHALVDHEWHHDITDGFKAEIAPAFGIDCREVYFSGFGSQGDGACFEGSFEYHKGMTSAVKRLEIYNSDGRNELFDIAKEMASLQKTNFYGLYGDLSHSHSRHVHPNSVYVNVHRNGLGYLGDIEPAPDTDEQYEDCLRDLMHWLYRQLQDEYEHLTSDETIADWLQDSDCQEFTGDGELYA